MSQEQENTAANPAENNEASAPEPKLSPLEAIKRRQAEMRQGLQQKAKGAGSVKGGSVKPGGQGATPKQQNSPRRQGGS